jgi:hypothetical protein
MALIDEGDKRLIITLFMRFIVDAYITFTYGYGRRKHTMLKSIRIPSHYSTLLGRPKVQRILNDTAREAKLLGFTPAQFRFNLLEALDAEVEWLDRLEAESCRLEVAS